MRVFQSLFRRPLSWTLLRHSPFRVFFVTALLLYVPLLLIRIIVLRKRSLYGLFGPYVAWWAGELTWSFFFSCVSYILVHTPEEKIPAWMRSLALHIPSFVGGYTVGIFNHIRAIKQAQNEVEVQFNNQIDTYFHDFIVFGVVLYLCFVSVPLLFLPGGWKITCAKAGMVLAYLGFWVTWFLDRPGDKTRFLSPIPN